MRIAMFTNTYLPHVGGVANSVDRFTRAYRRRGHRVLVVAPEYRDQPDREEDVLRVPAIQNFNGSDFSVVLPVGQALTSVIEGFRPDLIHTHHPYLIGATALRVAAERRVPICFTHHTLYEHYTHYVPLDSTTMQTYVKKLATGYANLCDGVIAPSESVAALLRRRGVTTTIRVAPTGVNLRRYAEGNGGRFRSRHAIPADAFLIGHVGRLAPEKNLSFLTRAVAAALDRCPDSRFLVVGSGPSEETMRAILRSRGMADRARFAGVQKGQDLVDAYHAMGVFAFASKTETQGMVLVEAVAAGCPVVALDAPGAREVVRDERNGRLLQGEDAQVFTDAVNWVAGLTSQDRAALQQRCRDSAKPFDTERCVEKAVSFYRHLLEHGARERERVDSDWESLLRALKQEWDLWATRARSLADAVGNNGDDEPELS